ILRSFGVDKLIFATDYPDSRCLKADEIYERYFEILGKMDFSQKEAEQICKHNALRMIGER
ncbi:amidohydrolase, partial [Salmonella enterica subsp. enterica serovar Mbandaka]|nr:amidohydrolase [Salmonella enterica subsp. enterica serovar Mbandaka]